MAPDPKRTPTRASSLRRACRPACKGPLVFAAPASSDLRASSPAEPGAFGVARPGRCVPHLVSCDSCIRSLSPCDSWTLYPFPVTRFSRPVDRLVDLLTAAGSRT